MPILCAIYPWLPCLLGLSSDLMPPEKDLRLAVGLLIPAKAQHLSWVILSYRSEYRFVKLSWLLNIYFLLKKPILFLAMSNLDKITWGSWLSNNPASPCVIYPCLPCLLGLSSDLMPLEKDLWLAVGLLIPAKAQYLSWAILSYGSEYRISITVLLTLPSYLLNMVPIVLSS